MALTVCGYCDQCYIETKFYCSHCFMSTDEQIAYLKGKMMRPPMPIELPPLSEIQRRIIIIKKAQEKIKKEQEDKQRHHEFVTEINLYYKKMKEEASGN